jgi:hypothetical protein
MFSPLVQAAADAGVTTLRLSTPMLKPYGTVIMVSEAVDNATHGAIDGAQKPYWAEPLTRMIARAVLQLGLRTRQFLLPA